MNNRFGHTSTVASRIACPDNSTGTPAVNPTVCACNDPYVPDAAQTSCIQEQYKLSLTPGTATIEPGNTYTFNATVTNQDGSPTTEDIPITVKVEVDLTSGGHEHGNSTRPKGSVSPASGNTALSITFGATEISGTHTITATCDLCSNSPLTATVTVKVEGLSTIPDSPFYALQDSAGNVIGAIKNKHSDNHYLTGAAIGQLVKLAKAYRAINPGAKLYLNDASLEWGGLFDVGSTPWQPPHAGHRLGEGLDIRAANSGPNNEGAVPTTLFHELRKEARENHIKAALHCTDNDVSRIGAPCNGIPNNRHFHVDF